MPTTTTYPFQAEVNEVLRLVIHSLYSHKEIFLRELLSNASDALDKLRFRAVTSPELMKDDASLEIRIVPDKDAGTLTIEDTGIGMSEEELVKDLGTVARSGSRAFLEQLAAEKEGKRDVSLIGQFGVGFYSAYLVADRVEVVSRAAGSDAAYRWVSEGKDSFSVEPAERKERGTSVVLHLKSDQKEFLEEWRVRDLVAHYSDYVSHPIKLKTKDALETINKASALWQRPKSEITDEQYDEFYKHLTHQVDPPLARTHFKVEGSQEFFGLLFVPRKPPFDLDLGKRRGVRLFVKRVFIMEDCEELVPQWLRFLRGVVDSDDLPLNVSRELLQDSAAVRTIKKQVTKKTLDLMDEIAKDRPKDYEEFWASFGAILKEGIAMDLEFKDRIAALARYRSSHGDELTSLSGYVSRMKPDQPAIYYVLGESLKAASTSPHLEALRQRGYEVLYMTDPVDDWATEALREFEKKPLVSAMRADLKLGESDEDKKKKGEQETALKPLLEKMRAVLGDHVKEVRVSDRLTDSPACLVRGGHESHAFVERLLKERGHAVPQAKRILEVNASHPVIKKLEALLEKEPDSPRAVDFIEVLYGQAVLTEGSSLDDPNRFAQRVTSLLAAVTDAS